MWLLQLLKISVNLPRNKLTLCQLIKKGTNNKLQEWLAYCITLFPSHIFLKDRLCEISSSSEIIYKDIAFAIFSSKTPR